MEFTFKKDQVRAQYATFNTTVEIITSQIKLFSLPDKRFDFLSCAREHGLPVAFMINSLNELRIIENVFVNPYSVSVKLFDGLLWDKDIDKIVESAVVLSAILEEKNKRSKLTIKTYPNKMLRSFKLNAEISETHSETFYRPIRETSQGPLNRVGKTGKPIVEAVMKIPGVTWINITAYELRVEIAELFDWKKIQPQVIELIAKEVGYLNIVQQ